MHVCCAEAAEGESEDGTEEKMGEGLEEGRVWAIRWVGYADHRSAL